MNEWLEELGWVEDAISIVHEDLRGAKALLEKGSDRLVLESLASGGVASAAAIGIGIFPPLALVLAIPAAGGLAYGLWRLIEAMGWA